MCEAEVVTRGWDTIQTRDISTTVDEYSLLIVRVNAHSFFGRGGDGEPFVDVTNRCDYARVEVANS